MASAAAAISAGSASRPRPTQPQARYPSPRLDEEGAAGGQRVEIAAHRLVLEHKRVHGRREEQRRARGRIERGEEVVGDAVGQLADDVRRRRRDEKQINRRRDGDVLDVGVRARRELIGDDLAARDRLEGDRAHETRGRVRHDGDDLVAVLLQAARNFDGLVGPDTAANA